MGVKVGIAVFVLAVFGVFLLISNLSQQQRPEKKPTASVDQLAASFRPAPLTLPPVPRPAPPPRVNQAPAPTSHEMTAAESPIFAFSGSEPAGRLAQAEGALAATTSASPPSPQLAPAVGKLATKLQPTVLSITRAALLPHPDMLITQGTIIPCTLQTAIDTQLPGFVKCVLPKDVRSTTGNVTLLDRGTVVTGEIQTSLAQGQNRAFVLWNRAETPDHAVITLASPGTDEVGRAGVPGVVDTHLWERFGGAIMLSFIQGTLQAGAAVAGSSTGSGGGTYVNSFQSNGSQVADTALENSINIPPTLRANQGDSVSIFVARDLDFSDVYRLEMARPR